MDNEFRRDIKVTVPSEREKVMSYNKFIIQQQEPFILFINYVNKYINELREKGIISNFLEIRARIKSSNSALKNDQSKVVDDVFGIEFVCATEKEIEVVEKYIEKIVSTIKKKKHNKDNGYKALHCMYVPNDETVGRINSAQNQYDRDFFPVVEIQYKTIAVDYEANYGSASHEKYKKTDMEEIQRLYNSGKLIQGIYIPYMWVSDINSDKMRELTSEEAIKKMYPSLNIQGRQNIEGR